MNLLVRPIAAVAATCLFAATLPLAPARANMVGTHEIASATQAVRADLHRLLDRAEVRQALAERGVAPAQVQARVDALTDDEAAEIARQIDTLPAGGDVLGLLFTVFVILLVTDILGLTRVFPFTRPIR